MQRINLQEEDIVNQSNLNIGDLSKALSLTAELSQDKIILSKEDQFLTAHLKIEGNKLFNKIHKRPTLDIFCVIDISGSMSYDNKIGLVKESLLYLLEVLEPEDRITLITFHTTEKQVVKSKLVNNLNKQAIQESINAINANWENEMHLGLNQAFNTIKSSKSTNQVTAILVLSDGDCGSVQKSEFSVINYIDGQEKDGNKSKDQIIHTFGYGNDSDFKTLNKQSERCGGNFHFVSDVKKISSHFQSCIKGIASTIAEGVNIDLELPEKNIIFPNNQFHQTVGDNWSHISNTKQSIKLNSLKDYFNQDFVCQIKVPGKFEQSFCPHAKGELVTLLKTELKINTSQGAKVISNVLSIKVYDENSTTKVIKKEKVQEKLTQELSLQEQEKAFKFLFINAVKEASECNRKASEYIQMIKHDNVQLKNQKKNNADTKEMIQQCNNRTADQNKINELKNQFDFIKRNENLPGLEAHEAKKDHSNDRKKPIDITKKPSNKAQSSKKIIRPKIKITIEGNNNKIQIDDIIKIVDKMYSNSNKENKLNGNKQSIDVSKPLKNTTKQMIKIEVSKQNELTNQEFVFASEAPIVQKL